jgi:ribosome maturation factor RimP
MINAKHISSLVDEGLKDTGIFLVETEIRQGNHIRVYIDSREGVTIEECAKISRIIESGLDRETEDFDLEVSSPGLDAPLKILPQYIKNVGRDVEVIRNDGIKLSGKLLSADNKGIMLEVRENTKDKTAKTKEYTIKNEYISFSDIKTTRQLIIF